MPAAGFPSGALAARARPGVPRMQIAAARRGPRRAAIVMLVMSPDDGKTVDSQEHGERAASARLARG